MSVFGYCPMGCGETLFVDDGSVTCSSTACPRDTAVAELLADPETEHIVVLGSHEWSAKHPLRERLDDELHDCGIELTVARTGARRPVGKYRVSRVGEVWEWQAIES